MLNTKIIALTVSVVSCAVVFSQSTNILFLPGETSLVGADRADTEAAIRAGECGPADQDPAGHWGAVVGGLQLSLRARTNVFVKREPMKLRLILRNTTTNACEAPPGYPLADVRFRDEAGRDSSAIPDNGFSSPLGGYIPPGRQLMQDIDLATVFAALSPGVYQVYSVGNVFKGGKPSADGAALRSGTLTIRLVPQKGDSDTQTPSPPK